MNKSLQGFAKLYMLEDVSGDVWKNTKGNKYFTSEKKALKYKTNKSIPDGYKPVEVILNRVRIVEHIKCPTSTAITHLQDISDFSKENDVEFFDFEFWSEGRQYNKIYHQPLGEPKLKTRAGDYYTDIHVSFTYRTTCGDEK